MARPRYGEDHDFVKVLDFGIIKAVTTTKETGPALAREMTVHGTPAVMAPEQAFGSADVDGRTDIYATGCVAYCLLAGQQVHTTDTSIPTGRAVSHIPITIQNTR